MVVGSGVLGELEQALAKLGERVTMTLTFALELAPEVDDRVCCVGRLRPGGEGQLAADEIEVEVDESLFALTGEVERDAVGCQNTIDWNHRFRSNPPGAIGPGVSDLPPSVRFAPIDAWHRTALPSRRCRG